MDFLFKASIIKRIILMKCVGFVFLNIDMNIYYTLFIVYHQNSMLLNQSLAVSKLEVNNTTLSNWKKARMS